MAACSSANHTLISLSSNRSAKCSRPLDGPLHPTGLPADYEQTSIRAIQNTQGVSDDLTGAESCSSSFDLNSVGNAPHFSRPKELGPRLKADIATDCSPSLYALSVRRRGIQNHRAIAKTTTTEAIMPMAK